MAARRRGRSVAVSPVPVTKEGAMPVGEIFLYGVWAAIAIVSIIATAAFLRSGS
jgi:hypothetical protein